MHQRLRSDQALGAENGPLGMAEPPPMPYHNDDHRWSGPGGALHGANDQVYGVAMGTLVNCLSSPRNPDESRFVRV